MIPGQDKEIVFRLGAGYDQANALSLVKECKGSEAAHMALEKVRLFWDETLNVVQISTPDYALNTLVNGWLMYQTLACRIWARSGYYQSGGAYGFRDQ